MPSPKHSFLVLIAVASLFFAWPLACDWVRGGGNLLNPVSFFMEPYRLGGAPAFLTVDIAVAWIAYMVWVVPDARRIGLGAKCGWAFLALSFLGTCFAFPLYLVVRERHLDKNARAGER